MMPMLQRMVAIYLRLQERFLQLTSHKTGRWGVFGFVTLFGIFMVAGVAHAAEPTVVDRIALVLASIAMFIAQALGQLVVLIIDIAIKVMLYNDFATSPVVSAGWAVVRDVVNMFFVIVLIYIAFGTIFGVGKFQWQQQVPKLLLFALVINFSKTLAGLIIDFGQVIMLTFANAIKEIAAGNFIQLLGLGEILSISTASEVFRLTAEEANAAGPEAFDWFAAGIMAVFMMLLVTSMMLALLVILVWRIVMLWVLVTIAPLTWFGGAIAGIGSMGQGMYSQWWKRFTCAVAIGPVITFFLWLTLAVAGSGNIAANAGFTAGASSSDFAFSNISGSILQIFEWQRMTSFILGIAMIMAGFQAAQDICSGASSFVGNALNRAKKGPNTALGYAKRTAAFGAKVGARGGRLGLAGARRVGGAAGRELGGVAERIPLARTLTQAGRADLYRRVAQNAGSGVLGRAINRAASSRADNIEAGRRQQVAEAGKKYEGMSDRTKIDQLERLAQGSGPVTKQGRLEMQALMKDALGNEKMLKQLEASGALKKLWDTNGAQLEADFAGDATMSSTITDFKKRRADLTGSAHLIQSQDDIQQLDAAALQSRDVREQLKKITTTHRKKDGTFYDAEEAMKLGLFGAKKKDVFTRGRSALMDRMTQGEIDRLSDEDLAGNASSELLARNGGRGREILMSRDQGVRDALNGREDSKEIMADLLRTHAGLNQDGSVDADAMSRFEEAIKSNPHLLGNLESDLFAKVLSNTDTRTLATGSLDRKTLQQIVKEMKSKPEDPHTIELGRRIKTMLDTEVTTKGDQLTDGKLEASVYFDDQMTVLDATRASRQASRERRQNTQSTAAMDLTRQQYENAIRAKQETEQQITELNAEIAELNDAIDNPPPGEEVDPTATQKRIDKLQNFLEQENEALGRIQRNLDELIGRATSASDTPTPPTAPPSGTGGDSGDTGSTT